MTLGLSTTLRNNRLDQIRALIDAGVSAGLLRIYDGARPATGGAPTTKLAELTLSDPCAPGAAGGQLTLSAIGADLTADATGTATWFRIVDSAGNFVMDGSVTATGGGGDITFNTVAFVAGAQVTITSAVFTEGNP